MIQTYNESSDVLKQLLSSVMDWHQNASRYIQRSARDKHVTWITTYLAAILVLSFLALFLRAFCRS